MIIDPPSNDPTYHSQVDSITSDKRGRVTPRSALRRMVIALDNAFNAQPFRVNGDFIFFDSNSTGVATVQLNNTSEDPWPALALSGVTDLPITDIYLTSGAQPGKVLNLWYGYRARFLNPVQAIATIGSILNPVRVQDTGGSNTNVVTVSGSVPLQPSLGAWLTHDVGFAYSSSYDSNAAISAGATNLVFAAGSNPNGVEIFDAVALSNSAAVQILSLIAKATAPTNSADGEIQMIGAGAAGVPVNLPSLTRPRFITSGKGLHFFSASLETNGGRSVKYQLF